MNTQTTKPTAYSEPIQAAYCFQACQEARQDVVMHHTNAGTTRVNPNSTSASFSKEGMPDAT